MITIHEFAKGKCAAVIPVVHMSISVFWQSHGQILWYKSTKKPAYTVHEYTGCHITLVQTSR